MKQKCLLDLTPSWQHTGNNSGTWGAKKSYYLAHGVLLLDNTRAAFENEPFFKVLWLAAPHKQQGNSNWVKVTRSQKLKLPPDEISYLISSTTGLVQHSWDDHRFSMTSQRSNRRKKAFRAISPFVSWWLFAHMLSSLFETIFNMSVHHLNCKYMTKYGKGAFEENHYFFYLFLTSLLFLLWEENLSHLLLLHKKATTGHINLNTSRRHSVLSERGLSLLGNVKRVVSNLNSRWCF